MAIKYLDPVLGLDTNDGSSFVSGGGSVGPWRTLSGKSASLLAGDTLRMKKSPDPTSLGQSATWPANTGKTVTLTTAVTQDIDMCESGWTSSPNVTTTYPATQKQGSANMNVSLAAGFAGGLVSFKALSSLDLSGYEQISFWINGSSTTIPSGLWEIRLCSDVSGGTAVDTFPIPLGGLLGWHAFTLPRTLGGALGSAINSIALYTTSDPATIAIRLDNIIACKAASAADSLSLNSVIGKNIAGEYWFPIQSISGTTITIDNDNTNQGANGRGYYGASGSATIWKRQPLYPSEIGVAIAVTATADLKQLKAGGTLGSGIYTIYSGGWSDDTTQDGETWFDGINGAGFGIGMLTAMTAIEIEKIGTVRYNFGFNLDCYDAKIFNCSALACATGFNGVSSSGRHEVNNCAAINCNGGGLGLSTYGSVKNTAMIGSLSVGGQFTRGVWNLDTCRIANNGGSGGQAALRALTCRVNCKNSKFELNPSGSFENTPGTGSFMFHNCLMLDSVEDATTPTTVTYQDRNFSHDHDQTPGNHVIFFAGGTGGKIQSDSVTRHTASGISWKMSPLSTTHLDEKWPLFFKIATIYLKSGVTTTVKAWLRRDNTGIQSSIACRGGQVAGIANDVTAPITVGANTWEQVTIVLSPSADGPVDIEAWAYGGTTFSAWVDDLSVS
jgi:hypothetical protein